MPSNHPRSPVLLQVAACLILVLSGGCAPKEKAPPPATARAHLAPAGAPALEGRLLLTGSSTLAPLASEVGRRFEARHPGVRIDVQTGGSSRGIADAARGLADLGMSSRDLEPSEQESLLAYEVARDGVAFLVHRDNPVPSLDREQLRRIFTGRVDNWREVGGRDAPLTVIGRTAGRSEVTLVSRWLGIRPDAFRSDLLAGENQQGIKMITGNPDAITYLSLGAAETEQERGLPLRALPLEGVPATSEAIAEGHYPLTRSLLFVSAEEAQGLRRAFLEFARSEEVHDLVEGLAFVPVS